MTIGELHRMLSAALAENPGWENRPVLVLSTSSYREMVGEHVQLPGAGIDYGFKAFILPVEAEPSSLIGRAV